MEVKGFEITRYGEKDITFQKKGENKKIRVSTLAKQFGEVYTKENIEKRMCIYRLPRTSEQTVTNNKKTNKKKINNNSLKTETELKL